MIAILSNIVEGNSAVRSCFQIHDRDADHQYNNSFDHLLSMMLFCKPSKLRLMDLLLPV